MVRVPNHRPAEGFCGGAWQGFADAEDYDCVASYRALLRHVIEYAGAARLDGGVKIFRSTTAAWLKWGNWRVNWTEHDRLQPFTQSWLTVAGFNDLAVPLFREAGWHVVDGFGSTIGRPDHTEVTS